MHERSTRQLVALTAAVFLLEVFALLVRAQVQVKLSITGMASDVAEDLSYLLVPVLTFAVLVPLLGNEIRRLPAWLRVQRCNLRLALVAMAIAVCVRLLYWGLLVAGVSFGLLAGDTTPGKVMPEFWFQCPAPVIVCLALLSKSILTPLVEEIINRGWFLNWFSRYGRVPAVLLSAGLFALLHRYGALWYACLFGVIAGRFYLNTGTLWAPIVAHATLNALAVLDWRCLHGTWNPVPLTGDLYTVGMLGVAIALGAMALAWRLANGRIAGTALLPTPPGRHRGPPG